MVALICNMILTAADELSAKVDAISLGNKKTTPFAEINQVLLGGSSLILYSRYASEDDDGIFSIGVRSGANSKYSTYRHSVPLVLGNDKEGDIALGSAIQYVVNKVSAMLGADVKSPLTIYKAPDGTDKVSMWCRLIEGKDGKIYTRVYDREGRTLPIETLTKSMIVRPALTLSVTKTKDGVYHMKCTIKDMCVIRTMVDEIAAVLVPARGLTEDAS